MKQRVIIVSNRLPINITEKFGKLTLQRSNGGLATAMSSVMKEYKALWIGWPGAVKPKWRHELDRLRIDRRLKPLYIPQNLLKKYYERVSNGGLWPMLHGFGTNLPIEDGDWEAYIAVNRRFAKQVAVTARAGDTIWVHDYHLLLVPQMLREMGVTNRIGFFLHTPFARKDCLADLPAVEDVLQSLSQVDVLGFQTERDSTSFTDAIEAAGITMRAGARVRAFPIGVDYQAYHDSSQLPKVKREMAAICAKIPNQRVILSISRLDYTKGIVEQLQAFEKVLKDNTEKDLLYKVIVAPSREDAAGYRELKEKIDETVMHINEKYGSADYQPIDYTYRNCGFEEVNAWYALAEILLITPRIDGMNLVVKEFIASRRDDQGVLVLSNTIGAAHQLTDALLVDPLNVSAIAKTVQQALAMAPNERKKRWRALRNNVQTQDVFWWVREFLGALDATPKEAFFSHTVHESRLRFSNKIRSSRISTKLIKYAQLRREKQPSQ